MSLTWNTLLQLTEASDKDAVMSYITSRYGEHEADEIRSTIEKGWNPEGLKQLGNELAGKFSDPKINSMVSKGLDKIKASNSPGGKAEPQRSGSPPPQVTKRKGEWGKADPGVAANKDRTRLDRMAGLQSGDYIPPEQHKANQDAVAATANMRPDRAGTAWKPPASKGSTVKPGERPEHDVGTAGQSPGSMPGHTRPVQKQVSQQGDNDKTVAQQMDFLQGLIDKDPKHPQADKIHAALDKLSQRDPNDVLKSATPKPTSAGTDLQKIRGSLDQMKQRLQMLQGIGDQPGLIKQTAKRALALKSTNPGKAQELQQQLGRMRQELNDLPKKIKNAEMGVDRVSNTGKSGVADAQKQVDMVAKEYPNHPQVAAKLAQKLGVPPTSARTTTSVDDTTGKSATRVAIWSADKIQKWKQQAGDSELAPGVYDLPGKPDLPAPGEPAGKAASKVHKPMMKAPKGLDKKQTEELANLRRKYSKLKKSGAGEDELALAKEPIMAIMAQGSEISDAVMPGRFDGDTWRPSGISKSKLTMRPDKTTGKMAYGKSQSDPHLEGQQVVWDTESYDWLLPSVKLAKDAERKVSGATLDQPDGERRPWQSNAQSVAGNIVPGSSAADQRIMQHAAAQGDNGKDKKQAQLNRKRSFSMSKSHDEADPTED